MTARFGSQASSHPGAVRRRNEDSFFARDDVGLWAVADGAGGHGGGDIASAAVVAALGDLPSGLSAAEMLAQVRLRIGAVHQSLRQRRADEQGQIMASTVVALVVRGSHFACLWAGDSRAYLFRADMLTQITHDHTVVQELLDSGRITPDIAASHPDAHVITRAVGGSDPFELDKRTGKLSAGDMFLLCSDGLFNALSLEALAAMVREGLGAADLVEAAVKCGARDNVSAVTVQTR